MNVVSLARYSIHSTIRLTDTFQGLKCNHLPKSVLQQIAGVGAPADDNVAGVGTLADDIM